MTSVHKDQIRKICQLQETREEAEKIYHLAASKTAPGTGFELKDSSIGLPAVCALLASRKLGNDDVNENVAQQASCLEMPKFRNAMLAVKKALASKPQRHTYSAPVVTYEAVVQAVKLGKNVNLITAWCGYVESELAQRNEDYRQAGREVTVAVFCWTCQLLKIMKVKPDVLRAKYGVSDQAYVNIISALESTCQDAAELVQEALAALKKNPKNVVLPPATTTASDVSFTLSRSLSKSPSKSAMKARMLDGSPSKTPTHKRKVVFSQDVEEAGDLPETPSKRPKFSSPLKSARLRALHEAGPSFLSPAKAIAPLPAPTPSAASTPARSSRYADDMLVEEVMAERIASTSTPSGQDVLPSTPRRRRQFTTTDASDVERSGSCGVSHAAPASSVREDMEARRPRRHRPILSDHKQWLQGDPRLAREWEEIRGRLGRVEVTF
ncbi:hypothetical protein OBBRIDRAFT_891088 [Obba rivulosa]|uniref:Origin recognition complex subunit 6 n=1 Tax=Obba rivulosa TaxID=1052685 RepID=A0A8E2AJB9_9APHY|nr:hypothetical protein OBBRIDRAFT_891088 [Obba rivulosa]